MPLSRSVLLLCLLVGCDARDRTPAVSPASFSSVSTVVAYEAVSSVGVAPHRGVVRAVNSFGASIAADPKEFTVDGNPTWVQFDGLGYGGIVRSTAGRVEVGGVEEAAILDTLVSDWAGMELHHAVGALVDEPEIAVAVTTGGLVSRNDEVFWVGSEQGAHRVLRTEGPIKGMQSAHIDVDGLLDAIIWTEGTVFLLRGRPGGGMAWGGTITAPGLQVAGAAVGDLSGDNLPDVAVAWVDGAAGLLDVWNGDGLYQFEAAEPTAIPGVPWSIAVGDNTGEEQPQITVLHDGGGWARYIEGAPGRYIPIGPITPQSVVLPTQATLGTPIDINADGGAELPVLAPLVPGSPRELYAFDLLGDQIEFLPVLDEVAAFMAFADGDGDYVDDIWTLNEERQLSAIAFSSEAFAQVTYDRHRVMKAPSYGPFDLGDVNHDGVNDLFLAGQQVWWFDLGVNAPYDDERYWEEDRFSARFVREELEGAFVVAELDGDPATLDFVAFHVEAGITHLQAINYEVGGGRAPLLADVSLPGGPPVDLAMCGTKAYAIAGNQLHLVDWADPQRPQLLASVTREDARAVTCGAGPQGAAVGLAAGDEVVLYGANLGEIATTASPGVFDVAFGDLGAGVEARSCNTEGCSVVFWPWGAEGQTSLVVSDPQELVLFDAAGVATATPARATDLRVVDLDHDGNLDVLGLNTDDGLITLMRSSGVSPAAPELFHSAAGWQGGVVAADGDGDGHLDLFAIDDEGDLRYTQPWRPEPTETTPTPDTGAVSTGDTGAGSPTHTGDTGIL